MTLKDRVLSLLAAAPGEFIATSDIVDRIYGWDEDGGPLHANENIRSAVRKLRQDGFRIETTYGRGYRLVDADTEFGAQEELLQFPQYRPTTEAQKAEIRRLRRSGKSIRWIAMKLGISLNRVVYWSRAYGLSAACGNGPDPVEVGSGARRFTAAEDAQLLALADAGESFADMALRLGRTLSTCRSCGPPAPTTTSCITRS